jgi:triosephosphate isomerase
MRQRKLLLAGNWKMHKLNRELEAFFSTFAQETGLSGHSHDKAHDVEILFAVPCTLLSEAARHASHKGIRIAAQNVHWETSGAYTGEISVPMLQEINISSTLIGHSERRQYFGETDQTVALKVKATLSAGMMPILCVGETLSERESGATDQVVRRQLEIALESVQDPGPLVIAYEPVWAIGTGRSATSHQAQEVHAMIRDFLLRKFGSHQAHAMRILYGGSANPQNIVDLLAQKDIDGALVGGASLKPGDFAQMVRAGFAC